MATPQTTLSPKPGYREVVSSMSLTEYERLSKDVRESLNLVTPEQARYLVDTYYRFQGYRVASGNQTFALGSDSKPHAVIDWLTESTGRLERNVSTLLGVYANSSPLGKWAQSITGVGPILTAGLMANIDITKCPTVGHIWSFAGLNPKVKWLSREQAKDLSTRFLVDGKVTTETLESLAQFTGKVNILSAFLEDLEKVTPDNLAAYLSKRPWNDLLKVLCWKLGESFTKTQNKESDVYGKVYARRKLYEQAKNEAGEYAEQAKTSLETKKYRADTVAKAFYLKGQLPPARIHLRAARYAVKLFLSAYHEVAYFLQYDRLPPLPYPVSHLGHAHVFSIPNADLIPGLEEAQSQYPRTPISRS